MKHLNTHRVAASASNAPGRGVRRNSKIETIHFSKRALDKAEPIEHCYRAVLEISSSPILLLSPESIILGWNRAAETISGWMADEALGRAYGDPTPIAFDLEWYATGPPTPIEPVGDRAGIDSGYEQLGVVHGAIEVLGEPRLELTEVPAHRWHRWTTHTTGFGPLALPEVRAHAGVRAPFAFPDGGVSDLVLTPEGWARRVARPV